MEAALQAFLITVAIVGGILSPFILIMLINAWAVSMKALAHKLEGWAADMQKRPPFDEVEVNVNPATNVMTARFLRKGSIIWQGASSRREMEENNILTFTDGETK